MITRQPGVVLKLGTLDSGLSLTIFKPTLNEQSMFKPRLELLCCVLGQDTVSLCSGFFSFSLNNKVMNSVVARGNGNLMSIFFSPNFASMHQKKSPVLTGTIFCVYFVGCSLILGLGDRFPRFWERGGWDMW